jgi:hypothetical protein
MWSPSESKHNILASVGKANKLQKMDLEGKNQLSHQCVPSHLGQGHMLHILINIKKK